MGRVAARGALTAHLGHRPGTALLGLGRRRGQDQRGPHGARRALATRSHVPAMGSRGCSWQGGGREGVPPWMPGSKLRGPGSAPRSGPGSGCCLGAVQSWGALLPGTG